MKFLILLLCLFPYVFSITIRDASVQGDGSDEDNPVEEGEELVLQCTTDSDWSSCAWEHEIEDQLDSDGNQMMVVCSGNQQHNGDSCSNDGGSSDLDNYARRIQLQTSATTCGLRINKADPMDHGEWKCVIRERAIDQGSMANIDVYASNQSSIYITKPDHFEDPDEVIEYIVGDSSSEIEAACTAYGGNPEPEFHWYVGNDDPDSEIDIKSPQKYDGEDDLGKYVTQKISWEPTREELCKFDETERFCDNYQFTFDLICKVVQRGANGNEYYRDENNLQNAMVTVDVRSGASKLLISSWISLLTVFVYVSKV